MTALVRYTGPRRSHIGAIGIAVANGVTINGRDIAGRSTPCLYQVHVDGECVDCLTTWDAAAAAMARLSGDAWPVGMPVSPAGLSLCVEGVEYQLIPAGGTDAVDSTLCCV